MGFNHFDENGNAVMVDVSAKEITERIAVASGKIHVNREVMEAIVNIQPKGRCPDSGKSSRHYGNEADIKPDPDVSPTLPE